MPLVVRTIPCWTATSDKWKRNYCTQAICGRALEKQIGAILICRISQVAGEASKSNLGARRLVVNAFGRLLR